MNQEKPDNRALNIFILYMALGVIVPFIAPEWVLSSLIARKLTEFMGTLVPFVERVAHLTPIPGRAQFYYSVMWLMWPVAVVNIIRRTSSAGYDRWLNLFISYGPIKSLCINGILLPAAILIIYSPPISDYPDRWDRGISGSVLGLAFGGSMVMDSVVLFSVSICMWIACIPKIYLNNRGLS